MTPSLLDLARKFDSAYRPGLNERISAAIENTTALDAEDQAAFDVRLSLAEQMRLPLGERFAEFESKYAELIGGCSGAFRPAETVLRLLLGMTPSDTSFGSGISWPTIASGEDIPCDATAMPAPRMPFPDELPKVVGLKCRLPDEGQPKIIQGDQPPIECYPPGCAQDIDSLQPPIGLPIEQVAPPSCAAVVLAMIYEFSEDTDGTVPVRVVVDGKKLAISRAEFIGGEILLKCG